MYLSLKASLLRLGFKAIKLTNKLQRSKVPFICNTDTKVQNFKIR